MRRVFVFFSVLCALFAMTGCSNMSTKVNVTDSKGAGNMIIDVRIAKSSFEGDKPLFCINSDEIAAKLTKDCPTDKIKITADTRCDKNYDIIHFAFSFSSIDEYNEIIGKLEKASEEKMGNLILSDYGESFLTVLGIKEEEEESCTDEEDDYVAELSIKADGKKADDKITLTVPLEQLSYVGSWFAMDLIEKPDEVFNFDKETFLKDALETKENISLDTEIDEEEFDKIVDGEVEVVFGSKSSGRIKLSTYQDDFINVSTILSDVQKMSDVVKIEDEDVPLFSRDADDDSPRTADLSSIFLATALCFSAAATAIVIFKKKKETQI